MVNQSLDEAVRAVEIFQGDRNITDPTLRHLIVKLRIQEILTEPPRKNNDAFTRHTIN